MDVFVNAELSLDGLAKEIAALFGMSVHFKTDREETWYEFQDEHMILTLGNHDYGNDKDIDFESYQYDIDVFVINTKSAEERMQRLHEGARRIFRTLKETQKYALMLVDDLQRKLDEFIPEAYQKEPSEYAIQARTLPEDIMLFVAGDLSLEKFSQEIERFLDAHAQLFLSERSGWKRYVLRTAQAKYTVSRNVYSDIYPAYQYGIFIQGRVYISGEKRYWQYESARTLFEQLKATERYRIALVGNLDEMVVEFVPES